MSTPEDLLKLATLEQNMREVKKEFSRFAHTSHLADASQSAIESRVALTISQQLHLSTDDITALGSMTTAWLHIRELLIEKVEEMQLLREEIYNLKTNDADDTPQPAEDLPDTN